jgi:hypothetical protein
MELYLHTPYFFMMVLVVGDLIASSVWGLYSFGFSGVVCN